MYYNPVKIYKTDNWKNEYYRIKNDLNILNPIVVTSQGNTNRLGLYNIFSKKAN